MAELLRGCMLYRWTLAILSWCAHVAKESQVRRGIAACGRRRRDVARAMVLREGRDRGRGENSKKSTAFHDVYLHHFF